jgi:hypothetical protein
MKQAHEIREIANKIESVKIEEIKNSDAFKRAVHNIGNSIEDAAKLGHFSVQHVFRMDKETGLCLISYLEGFNYKTRFEPIQEKRGTTYHHIGIDIIISW